LCIPPEDGHQGPKNVAAKIYKIFKKTAWRVVITLIKYAQQDAEPENKKTNGLG
jgi:hypothetical protein